MMGKIAILAEKPSQAKAYSDAFSVKNRTKTYIELNPCHTFPSGAIITWAIGHLVELKEPSEYRSEWKKWNLAFLPILPKKFEFRVVKDKRAHFAFIKKLFNSPEISTIINGCDVDREGSNIFYSIYKMTGAKNKLIKRLWINSLEVDEVRKGFNHLNDNKKDLLLYQEARARQISDWLVGMNGSRLYTLLLQQKGWTDSLAIGRVQSPTVYLIYQRQMEIKQFVPKKFYEIEGKFTSKNGLYKGKAKVKCEKKEEIQAIMQKHCISEQNDGIVQSIIKKEKRIKPPKLHALSTLQEAANKKWKYSPEKVLKIAQGLYEKKLITYPRTDTQFITNSEFAYLVDNVESYQNLVGMPFQITSKNPKKRYVDNTKVEEHYAIIPTKNIPTEKNRRELSREESNIYDEILRTMLAMFHSDYIYEETKVTTDVNSLAFYTKGKTEKSKGWKELFQNAKDNKPPNKKQTGVQALPKLMEGENVIGVIKLVEGETKPPKPYTEGQLIKLMKTCGKSVDDTNEMEILKEIEGLGTEATRSGIIETIKRHGYIEVKKNIVSVTKKGEILCQSIEGNLLSSPSMTAKWETYLNKIGNGNGSQEYFLSNIEKFIQKLMFEVPKQLQGETINNNLEAIEKKNRIAVCPSCHTGGITLKKSFYGCSNYKNGCKQTFPARILGKKLTQKHIKDLCTKGKTSVIKGLKSKRGKIFNAALVRQGQNIKFEFINDKKHGVK